MKNGNEIWDVLGDPRKRYRAPWAEIGKYWPGKEPIRLQDSLPYTLKKLTKLFPSAYWIEGRKCYTLQMSLGVFQNAKFAHKIIREVHVYLKPW